MKTVLSDKHALHFPKGELYGGELVRPFECPERWQYVKDALSDAKLTEFCEPDPLVMETVTHVHSAEFLSFLESAWTLWEREGFTGEAIPTVFPARRMQQQEPAHIDGKLGYFAMAIETAITQGTWAAACSSAACAQTAQRFISAGEAVAFSLCRPPGHHAAYDLYGGYCFLNNAAIAAQGLLNDGAARVAIVDVDFHHGNGTQDIFYQRGDVLFVSLHGDPLDAFPHFLGHADETGEGDGQGCNINYPMPPGTPYSVWRNALEEGLAQVRKFAPDALVVSLGVDTFEKDPISFFQLQSEDFSDYGQMLAELKLPTLFIMEGGYAVEEIGINTVNVLDGFLQSS